MSRPGGWSHHERDNRVRGGTGHGTGFAPTVDPVAEATGQVTLTLRDMR